MAMHGYPRELAERFGQNLKRARRRADLSQEEVSARADLYRTEIGLVERGARLPRLDTIIKLAGGIEIEPAELLAGLSWYAGSTRPGTFHVEAPVLPPPRRRPR
jgi:transcriptional regulator with XRE-family HTH domain